MERDRILTKLITQQLYTELLVIEWIIWATKTQPEFWLLQIQTWPDQFLGPMLVVNTFYTLLKIMVPLYLQTNIINFIIIKEFNGSLIQI